MNNHTSTDLPFVRSDDPNSGPPLLDAESLRQFAKAAVNRARARVEAARAKRAARTYPQLLKRPRNRRIHSADAGEGLQEPVGTAVVPDVAEKAVHASEDEWTRERIAQFAASAVARARARAKLQTQSRVDAAADTMTTSENREERRDSIKPISSSATKTARYNAAGGRVTGH